MDVEIAAAHMEELKGVLRNKLSEEDLRLFRDADYDNLASNGFFTAKSFEAATRDDLKDALPGRAAIVALLVKAFLPVPRGIDIGSDTNKRIHEPSDCSGLQPLRKLPRVPSAAARDALHPRTFYSGDAIVNLDMHYLSPWHDFDSLLRDIEEGKWLLLTAPWQSGKTTLLTALGVALQKRDYLVVLTTLDVTMVALGNNESKKEIEAAGDFFSRLVNKICTANRELKRPAGKVEAVADVFRIPDGEQHFRNVIWLVDEAQLLNDIHHQTGYAVYSLLSGLKEAKQGAISRNKLGSYRLHSFCLCGLPQVSSLIAAARQRRMKESECPYVASSPHRNHDPLRPHLSGWSSPLSKQVERENWRLNEQQVENMLLDFFRDRDIFFKMTFNGEEDEEHHRQAVSALSRNIIELTSGHTGLVGSCCDFLQNIDPELNILVGCLERWLQLVRKGRLTSHAFNNKVYGKMVGVVAGYPERVKSVILSCIDSVDGSSAVDSLDTVLEAIVDGVLVISGTLQVRFSSPWVLSVLLESCKFARLEVLPAPTESLIEVYEAAISFMNPDVFLRPKVLSATGQPSEYIIQSQFFRGLMFVMEQGLYTHKYNVFVEIKEMDENGVRRKRMDGYMEHSKASNQGIELEVGKSPRETRNSVMDHLKRCVYYKRLHDCEMHYMYVWVGEEDATGAKTVIKELQSSYSGVSCWYVTFLRDERAWMIERLRGDGEWSCTRKDVPSEFPSFLLSTLDNSGKRLIKI